GGLGIGGGGGGLVTGRGAATALHKLTWALAVAFLGTSIALTIIAAQRAGGSSVIERLGAPAPAPAEAPAAPGLPAGSDNLLPPSPEGGPVLPPPAN
ncbi:MAG: preprotein translocase subunit SecG, partial [Alphaproteobacteria bacterium]